MPSPATKAFATEYRTEYVPHDVTLHRTRPPTGGLADKTTPSSSHDVHHWIDALPFPPSYDWMGACPRVRMPAGHYVSTTAASFRGKPQPPATMFPTMHRPIGAGNVRYLQVPYLPDGPEFFPGKRQTSSMTTHSIFSAGEAAIIADADQRYNDRMNAAASASRISTGFVRPSPDAWLTTSRADFYPRPLTGAYLGRSRQSATSLRQSVRCESAPSSESLAPAEKAKRHWKSIPFVYSQPQTTYNTATKAAEPLDVKALAASMLL
ncbi:hypothetical protein AB1Y20_015465 [Prymnesium parvum]|uniref:Uncharacterized protein n=1 Tax=Prymnesium parvum TaxID=97485 RepID=A0AB34JWV0_PRYPA